MWKCRHCSYSFKWVYTLNYHLSEFHDEPTEPMAVPPKYYSTNKKHGNRRK